MKILSVRFENLNSLKGEWCIDFRHAPFNHTNLFAITGPTGAGKTTLLDAICLALYHRTPRLPQLSANQNEIMTRQTGSCFAEVEFNAGGKTYRAHWGQQRAYRKADGNLQPAHAYLQALDGSLQTDKLSEKVPAVVRVTGLDFERFTRSMLLAQGSFAAFLEADEKDRAALLERMTGTGIYAQISKRVYQQFKQEQQQLALKRAELAGVELLDEEARQALVSEQKALAQAYTKLEAQQRNLSQQHQWCINVERLQDAVVSAKAGLSHAQQQLAGSASERQALAQHQQAEKITPLFSAVKRLRQHAQQLNAAHQQSASAQQAASQRWQQQQWQQWQLAEQQAAKGQQLADASAQAIAKCTAEREAHAQRAKLGEYLRSWQQQQQYVVEQGRQAESIKQELAALQECNKQHMEGIRTAGKELASLASVLHTAEQEAEAAEHSWQQLLAQGDASFHQQQWHQTYQQLQQLGQAQQDWRRWQQAITQHKTAEQQQHEAQLQQKNITEQLAELAGHMAHGQQKRARQQEIVALERDIQALSKYREKLAPEQECPLCGATEHPHIQEYKTRTPQASEQALAILEEALAAQQATQQTLQGELTRWQERGRYALQESEHLAVAIAEHEAKVKQALTPLGLAECSPLSEALFAQWQQEWHAKEAAAKAAIAALEQQQQAVAKAQRTAQQAKEAWQTLHNKVVQAKEENRRRSETATEKQRLQKDAEVASYLGEKTLREELAELGYPWPADLPAWLAEQQTVWQVWQEQEQWLRTEQQRWQELATAATTWRRRAHQAGAAWQALAAEEQGWPRLTAAQPEQLYEQLNTSIQAAQVAVSTHVGECQSLVSQLRHTEQEADAAQQAWQQALVSSAFANEAAYQAALLPEAEAARVTQQQEALQQAVQKADIQFNQLQGELHTEVSKALSDKTAAALAAELAQMNAAIGSNREALGAINNQLAQDATWRAARAELVAEIMQQERGMVQWQRLNRFIGSAEGDAYRRFAQGLTLDHLIHVANGHLLNFHGRYQLQRQPANEGRDVLAMQVVDTWQANTVRQTATLSGGESFLVSLALAVALSDIVSHEHRIESLFLDEGFGTLDAETLDVALNALDNLNAKGKMIGVISHVEAMKERIPVQINVHKGAGLGFSQLDAAFKVTRA